VDRDGKRKITQAVILGLGSMFNHSTHEQNVGFERDVERQVITYRALRDIPAGEELCMQLPHFLAAMSNASRHLIWRTLDLQGRRPRRCSISGRGDESTDPDTVGLNFRRRYRYKKVKYKIIQLQTATQALRGSINGLSIRSTPIFMTKITPGV
jgi:hypothetical protein